MHVSSLVYLVLLRLAHIIVSRLQHLHWLPIKHRINFKIANITFRTLQSSQPVYLWSILHTHHSARSLRLSNTNLLCAPFVRTSFGSRSFSVAAPKIWNSLPPALRMCISHDTYRHQLKTHYFQQANPLSASSLAPQIRLWLTIVRIYKLSLLTYLLICMRFAGFPRQQQHVHRRGTRDQSSDHRSTNSHHTSQQLPANRLYAR